MKIFNNILLTVLVILSLATGVTKLIQMPEEMEIFKNTGYSDTFILIFGAFQVMGGILLVTPKTRKIAALGMALTFGMATAVLFQNAMTQFGMFSFLFIALALYQIKPITSKK